MEIETATDVSPMSKSKKKNLRRDMAAAGKAATAADPAKSEASTVAADNDIKQHVEDRLQQLVAACVHSPSALVRFSIAAACVHSPSAWRLS